jgi:hypothetical protein
MNEKIKDAIRNLSRTDRAAIYGWIDEEAAIDLGFWIYRESQKIEKKLMVARKA